MNDQRKAARKIFKVKAALALDGRQPMLVRTTDVSVSGVGVTVPDPVPAGATGQIKFDLLVDGKLVSLTAHVKAAYCIFSGGDFKVGLQFLNLDLAVMSHLARFLR